MTVSGVFKSRKGPRSFKQNYIVQGSRVAVAASMLWTVHKETLNLLEDFLAAVTSTTPNVTGLL